MLDLILESLFTGSDPGFQIPLPVIQSGSNVPVQYRYPIGRARRVAVSRVARGVGSDVDSFIGQTKSAQPHQSKPRRRLSLERRSAVRTV